MGRERLIGRSEECRRLDRCMGETQSQLIIVYGRRRVGKTYLIDQYYDKRFDFKITGDENQSRDIQLRNFTYELNRQTRCMNDVPSDWTEAFHMLREYLESLSYDEKRVVFFDEMPWLDTPKSGFLKAFEYFWNSWGYARDNLVCIVCGSVTSWLARNIDGNKGGLYNRRTAMLNLEPFGLRETEKYLQSRNIEWSRYDITECYMIMGGIPYYLSLLDPELSYRQNIDNLFFKKRSELGDEFDRLYRSLFTKGEQYIRLVETLAGRRRGLTRREIENAGGIPRNGLLTRMLDDLIRAGFVKAYNYFGHKKQDAMYQLVDYFSQFYIRFVRNNYGADEHYWSNSIDNPSRRAWAGLTFEQVCRDHVALIKKKLGISGVLSNEYAWFKKPGNGKDGDGDISDAGAQIDMLIDRRDMVITICEMKYSINEWSIDKDYDRVLRNKVDVFRRAAGTNKALQVVMITTYGVKKGKYSGMINGEVVLDDLFDEA